MTKEPTSMAMLVVGSKKVSPELRVQFDALSQAEDLRLKEVQAQLIRGCCRTTSDLDELITYLYALGLRWADIDQRIVSRRARLVRELEAVVEKEARLHRATTTRLQFLAPQLSL